MKMLSKDAKEFAPALTVVDTSTLSIFNDVNVAVRIKESTYAFIVCRYQTSFQPFLMADTHLRTRFD